MSKAIENAVALTRAFASALGHGWTAHTDSDEDFMRPNSPLPLAAWALSVSEHCAEKDANRERNQLPVGICPAMYGGSGPRIMRWDTFGGLTWDVSTAGAGVQVRASKGGEFKASLPFWSDGSLATINLSFFGEGLHVGHVSRAMSLIAYADHVFPDIKRLFWDALVEEARTRLQWPEDVHTDTIDMLHALSIGAEQNGWQITMPAEQAQDLREIVAAARKKIAAS